MKKKETKTILCFCVKRKHVKLSDITLPLFYGGKCVFVFPTYTGGK